MLHDAIEIRKIKESNDDETCYEVYDSDTGTSLGIFDTIERAEAERQSMKRSNRAAVKGGSDADPGIE